MAIYKIKILSSFPRSQKPPTKKCITKKQFTMAPKNVECLGINLTKM